MYRDTRGASNLNLPLHIFLLIATFSIAIFSGNEEAIWLANLLPSAGEEARKTQMVESGVEVPIVIEEVKTIENPKSVDVVDAQVSESKVNISLIKSNFCGSTCA